MKSDTYLFYGYAKCSTCRKAQKFLDERQVDYTLIDITKQPPTKDQLNEMASHYLQGDYRKLFNTSGLQYRALNLKEKLPHLDEGEMVDLLNRDGKLVKRPFLIGKGFGTVGFKQDVWDEHFK